MTRSRNKAECKECNVRNYGILKVNVVLLKSVHCVTVCTICSFVHDQIFWFSNT